MCLQTRTSYACGHFSGPVVEETCSDVVKNSTVLFSLKHRVTTDMMSSEKHCPYCLAKAKVEAGEALCVAGFSFVDQGQRDGSRNVYTNTQTSSIPGAWVSDEDVNIVNDPAMVHKHMTVNTEAMGNARNHVKSENTHLTQQARAVLDNDNLRLDMSAMSLKDNRVDEGSAMDSSFRDLSDRLFAWEQSSSSSESSIISTAATRASSPATTLAAQRGEVETRDEDADMYDPDYEDADSIS